MVGRAGFVPVLAEHQQSPVLYLGWGGRGKSRGLPTLGASAELSLNKRLAVSAGLGRNLDDHRPRQWRVFVGYCGARHARALSGFRIVGASMKAKLMQMTPCVPDPPNLGLKDPGDGNSPIGRALRYWLNTGFASYELLQITVGLALSAASR